jgi:hypothetical protein
MAAQSLTMSSTIAVNLAYPVVLTLKSTYGVHPMTHSDRNPPVALGFGKRRFHRGREAAIAL